MSWSALLRRVAVCSLLAASGCWKSSSDVNSDRPLFVDDGTPGGPVIRIRDAGPPGVSPTRVLISTGTDVFPQELIGGAPPDGTVWSIDPATPGTLVVAGRSLLEFKPETGFRPETSYTFTLTSMSALGDYNHAPDGGWKHSFTTPPFQFARATLDRADRKSGSAEISVWFTAPVDTAPFNGNDAPISFASRGRQLTASFVPTDHPQRVRVEIRDPALASDDVISVRISAGIPALIDAALRAPAAQAELKIYDGEPVEILAAGVREGIDGFFIDVICVDRAVTGRRWYWDSVTYDSWEVSTRCAIDEAQLKSSVRFDPAVEATVSSAPGGFRIFAPFERGTYQMRIDAGTTTVDGGILHEAFETELDIPMRTPQVRFVTRGRYLPRSSWHQLPISHRNVDRIEVQVHHIPEENLVFWMNGPEYASSATANLVVRREIAVPNTSDVTRTSWLDLGTLVPDAGNGVYEITLDGTIPEGGEHRSVARAAARIVRTDLHLVAKMEATKPGEAYTGKVHAFALGMTDNAGKSGVELKLIRPSGFVLSTCTTDRSGYCALSVPSPTLDRTPPMAILARSGKDLTFLKFSDLRLDAPSDTSGVPYVAEAPYDAAVYLDRGVYRPGDTAHVSAILRAPDRKAPAAGLPAVVRLFDPTGKELRKQVLAANAAGLLSTDLRFADFAMTGRYRVAVEVAENQVGSTSFAVEEFVPERLAVKATPAQTDAIVRAETQFDVAATWLFGGAAAGSRAEVVCRYTPTAFAPENRKGWSFGPLLLDDERSQTVDLGTFTAFTDDAGQLRATCPAVAQSTAVVTSGEVRATIAVFEGDSGRTTRGRAMTRVHPDQYYLGLRSSRPTVNPEGPTIVEGQIVDWEGKASTLAQRVDIEIIEVQREWGSVWDEASESSEFRSFYRRTRESTQQVSVGADGQFSVSFTPRNPSGDYLVAAIAGKTRSELLMAAKDPWEDWDPTTTEADATPGPVDAQQIEIDAPESTEVGQPVTVKFRSPFAGRALLSVETDEVLEHAWQDVPEGMFEWTFTPRQLVPNVYVTALVVKNPTAESKGAFLPGRAFGAASVRIVPSELVLPVTLSVPPELRPRDELNVVIDVGPQREPVFATVAAVDEGILSLTGFTDPDPLTELFRKRSLGVESFETIGWTIAVPPGGPGTRVGGDAAERGGRVQMVKPVALWSGVVEIPASGKTTVKLPLPGYRGSLRVMVVAATPSKVGHASAAVAVREPLTLQTTLPRFLSGGDVATIPVQVTNLSGKPRTVTVSIAAEDLGRASAGFAVDASSVGPVLEFTGGEQRTLKLAPDAAGSVQFTVRAPRSPAAARLRVEAVADDLRSFEEIELPISTPLPEARRTTRLELASGASDLAPLFADWWPGSERATIEVTADPFAPVYAHLRPLIQYPYGCIEQTVSSTWPLLYARERLEALEPEFVRKTPIESMVSRGIERAIGMQTPDGGFAYWPGGHDASPWATAYATHFLLEARRTGRNVPNAAIDDALNALSKRAETFQDSPDPAEPYIHYVLALGGRGRAAQAARRLGNLSANARVEDRYLLQAALFQTGDRRHEAALRAPDASQIAVNRANDGTFWSDLRGRALMLSVFADLFGDAPDADRLADVVARNVLANGSAYYTTQELAWAISGLSKWSKTPDGAIKAAKLRVGASDVAAVPVPKGQSPRFVFDVSRASLAPAVTLDVTRSGTSPTWVVATIEGTRKAPDAGEAGDGLSVQREWLNRDGALVDPTQLRLGGAYLVRLRLTNLTGRRIENVALVDRLPAGVEIENSRLGQATTPDWVDEDDLWELEHMDVRDDRIAVFGTLYAKQTVEVVYTVRAVTAGMFIGPEARAEAMYDPLAWSRTATQPTVVLAR